MYIMYVVLTQEFEEGILVTGLISKEYGSHVHLINRPHKFTFIISIGGNATKYEENGI
jgi:hypothetical protein